MDHRSHGPGNWDAEPACAGADPQLFFDPVDPGPALELCRDCPVRLPCLRYALDHEVQWGIWGGVTSEGRRHVRRSTLREVAARA